MTTSTPRFTRPKSAGASALLGALAWAGAAPAAVQIDLAVQLPALSIWGDTEDRAGNAVTTGDFNGDGRIDLAISEGNLKNRICLYFGPFAFPFSEDRAMDAPAPCIYGEVGSIGSYLVASDVDSDGFTDLLEANETGRGQISIFRGRAAWPDRVPQSDATWMFTGGGHPTEGDSLTSMGGGDISGDGIADLVLAASSADGPADAREGSGEAYVFFGPSTRWKARTDLAIDAPDVIIYGADGSNDRNPSFPGSDPGGDALGWKNAVLVADVLGDSTPDLILGAGSAWGPSNTVAGTGEVHVLRGRAVWPSVIDLRASRPSDLVVYGPQVGGLGGLLNNVAAADFDGDGKKDLVVGAPRAAQGTGRTQPGAVYLFRGGSALQGVRDLESGSADATIVGPRSYSGIGWLMATGDVNGDGFVDLITSGYLDFAFGRPVAGSLFVISGCDGFPTSRDLAFTPADLTVSGAHDLDGIGYSFDVADVDADGRDDLLTGFYGATSVGSARADAGEAHLVLGVPFDAACTIAPDAGTDLSFCGLPGDVSLDGSATVVAGCSKTPQYRWLDGTTVVRDWSPDPTIVVRPLATTTYTLEVRCGDCAGPCFASTLVVVAVDLDTVPPDLGNTLFAVRDTADVALEWGTRLEARSYALFRGNAKDTWPALPLLTGLAAPDTRLPDVDAPPNLPLHFYRAVGASCAGRLGP